MYLLCTFAAKADRLAQRKHSRLINCRAAAISNQRVQSAARLTVSRRRCCCFLTRWKCNLPRYVSGNAEGILKFLLQLGGKLVSLKLSNNQKSEPCIGKCDE